jgi:outer membrane protein
MLKPKSPRIRLAVLAGLASPLVLALTMPIDAWVAAQQVDPEYAAARAEYQAGATQSDQARALLLPQVEGRAGVGRASMESVTQGAQFATPAMGQSNQVDFRTSIHNGTRNQWSVQAEMPLINAGKWAQSRQLKKGALLAEVHLQQAQQDLILRTAQCYFDVIASRENLRSLTRQQQASEHLLKEKKRRYELGDIPITDSHEAAAQSAALQAQVAQAEAEFQLRVNRYQDLTQLSAATLPELALERDVMTQREAPLEEWRSRAMARSPLIVMQNYGVEVAHDEIDKYRALTAPTLSLVASVGSERFSGDGQYGPSTLNNNSRAMGLQLSIPLYSGGYRGARFEQAVQLEQKAGYDREAVRQWVGRQTEAAWLGLSSGTVQVHARRLALQSLAARLKATELGNQVGDRGTLDVLNAQSALAVGRMQLLDAQVELMMNRLRLYALAGQLDENQLRALAPMLTATQP